MYTYFYIEQNHFFGESLVLATRFPGAQGLVWYSGNPFGGDLCTYQEAFKSSGGQPWPEPLKVVGLVLF